MRVIQFRLTGVIAVHTYFSRDLVEQVNSQKVSRHVVLHAIPPNVPMRTNERYFERVTPFGEFFYGKKL